MTGRYGGVDEPYDGPVPYPPGHPDDGGRFALDAELTVHWPEVPDYAQEPR